MHDSKGVKIASRDIVARKVQGGWRISRASIVGFTDATKLIPIAVCLDFDSNGRTWQDVTSSDELLRICDSGAKGEDSEALTKRVPEMTKLLQDYELPSLASRIQRA